MTDSTYSLPISETVKSAAGKINGAKGSILAFVGLFLLAHCLIKMLACIPGLHGILGIVSWAVQTIGGGCGVYLGICRAKNQSLQWKMIQNVLTLKLSMNMLIAAVLQVLLYLPAAIVFFLSVYLKSSSAEGTNLVYFLLDFLAIIMIVYTYTRVSITTGFVVDKQLNAWQSIKASFCATKGNVWRLIALHLIVLFLFTLCLCTLGIGFIWGIPFFAILYGEIYTRLNNMSCPTASTTH